MTLKNWYEVDIINSNTSQIIRDIFTCINELKRDQLIESWFYLYERDFFRLRLQSSNIAMIEKIMQNLDIQFKSFVPYFEEDRKFSDEYVLDSFTKIMNVSSELMLIQFNNSGKIGLDDNFRFLERTFHCLHNIIRGDVGEIGLYLDILKQGIYKSGIDYQQTIYTES